MSVKVKQALTNCLTKIENGTFDEDTIRTLLIVSREYITDGLIKELAHFIAHPERNKGMFHRKINSRYAKFNLVSEQVRNADFNQLRQTIKTEDELSDFMLGGISVKKIESKLFDILYSDGLDDLPESHLIKYTGFNKVEVKAFLKRSYIKKEGFYYLSTNGTENLINAFKAMPDSMYDPIKEPAIAAELVKGEAIVKKIKGTMDGIQRVIRGAIFFDSVFDTKTFRDEIISTISKVINRFNIDTKYIAQLKQQSNDILLCIMTLLHDSKFILYDNNQARAYLCYYLDYDAEEAQKSGYDGNRVLYDRGVLALYLSGEYTMTFPLFVSDLPIHRFLSYDDYLKSHAEGNFSETNRTTASRIGEKILLT